MENLLEQARLLPETPGIYVMKDEHENILYIGKAKNLKARVMSYFLNSTPHSKKISQMLMRVDHFTMVNVASEFDALLLECHQIHENRPAYNTLMNHYENYGYFVWQKNQWRVSADWIDNALCLGPFYRQEKMKEFLQVADGLYHLSGPLQFVKGIIFPYKPNSTPEEKKAEYKLRQAELQEVMLGENTKMLARLDNKVSHLAEIEAFEQASTWWEKRLIVQRFLRRNQQLLAANGDFLFVGQIPEKNGVAYYLYGKGEILGKTVYQRTASPAQALKKLKKQVKTEKWRQLSAKKYLNKSDADLFPIFFNYLYRNGSISRFDFNWALDK